MEKILVTYVTKYGSTQGVAEKIAEVLHEQGLPVNLQPMRSVRSLTEYRAVVFGAPFYIGRWPKDAPNFLNRFQNALTQKPVAVFTLGPTHPFKTQEEEQGVSAQLGTELAKYPWLKPVAQVMFGGVFDPAKLRFPDSLVLKMPASPLKDLPVSDMRDWEQIRAWAAGLVDQLQPVSAD